MTATLPVAELEAQIHALPFEEKVRIARFAQKEIGEEPVGGDDPMPEWLQEELLRRERLVEEGKMELVDADTAFARVRAKLGYAK
jgi:hypothetical protein